MECGLKNKVALVAASSRGLGKAIAWALAKEGTKLVICARDKKVLEKTADDILLKTGVTVFPLAIDLTEVSQIHWLMDETLDLFGRVDILITNAGGPPSGEFGDLQSADWKQANQLTLMSAVHLSQAVIPGMQKQKWGRIIHLASVTARQPADNLTLSNIFRPAVIGLTKDLARQYAKDNILVNAVCPGYFLTDRVRQLVRAKAEKSKQKEEKLLKEMTRQIPLGRMGDPAELASMVVFLASENANYITGSVFTIDGGLVKGLY